MVAGQATAATCSFGLAQPEQFVQRSRSSGLAQHRLTDVGARLEIDDALTFTVPSARVDVANP